jgi:hypothetical protein
METQYVNLHEPIIASRAGPAPLVIRIGITSSSGYMSAGAMGASVKPEAYVLLSALPEDLRRRVELAIQALISGM